MSAIDERIVNMKFNNSQFMTGIRATLDALSNLKKGLNLDASKKGIEELSNAGRNFNLAPMATAVEGVNAKFLALATVAITALTNITNKAIEAGKKVISSLTVDPIKAGLQEYETNLNSIQTILANTQASGSTLSDVNGALKELNAYSDQTIYNFSEMARNIGTFTAAGVNLETSTASIKGIANLAALSGSNSQQASTAMYQLSQAISSGKVSLMDWNSVVNAGMGGSVFQRALAETAVKMGKLDESSLTLEGDMKNVKIAGESFRDSISAASGEESWLSSDVLTTTLSQFTGDLTDAELAAQGFTAEQIKAIQATAATAKSAATEVKTVSQLMGTLQEAAGSGWAQTWELIFGDFEEAKALWTGVNAVLGGMIGASADARNAVVGDWKALGGRDAAIDSVKNAFEAVMMVIKPIKEAFRDIFPATTGQQLYNITVAIRDFTENLKIGGNTAELLKRTFKGVFAIFDIGLMVIKGLIGMVVDLIGSFGDGEEVFLSHTASIGDWIVKLRDAIKAGEGLTTFFDGLGGALGGILNFLMEFGRAILDVFSGDAFNTDGIGDSIDRLKERLSPLSGAIDGIAKVWKGMGDRFKDTWAFFSPMAKAMVEFFRGIGDSIAEAVSGMDYTQILDSVNTGLFAALVLMLKKFLKGGINIDTSGGFFDSIKETFSGVTDTLSAMQAQLKAESLLKIAGAIAVLAAALVVIALIDPARLTSSLAAITVMFGQLIGSLAAFSAVMTTFGALKLTLVAGGLIGLAVAVVILATAVRMLSGLDWEELAKGLAGVTVLLAALAGTAKLLSGSAGGLVRAGAGLILVAVAVKILASAVEQFAEMDWAELARGLAGVSAALLAMALFTRLAATGKAAVAQGAGLILLAVALKLIASAVSDFAEMDWDTLGRGFAAMAIALLLIAGAMHIMPKNMLVTAAALVVVAGALVVVATALNMMGGMSWEEIAKGLVTLAGSLAIIAGALYLMTAALPGAAALVVAAAALAVLTPVLLALGGMSWEEIAKGLTMLAGVFLVLGVAGLVLAPLVPILIGLGAAITLIGIGVMAAGLGVLAFSSALLVLSAASAVGTVAIVAMVSAIIGLIPVAMTALANGIIAFALVIAGAAPQIAAAMGLFLMALLHTINKLAPAIVNTLVNLVMLLVNTIVNNVPKLVDAGLRMLTGILTGIANNIGRIVAVSLQIVTNFINGISAGIPGLVQSGINLVVTFVNSIANGIRANSGAMNAAGRNLATAIVQGMASGIGGGLSVVVNAAKNLAKNALNAAKSVLGIKSPSREFRKVGQWSAEGAALGFDDNAGMVVHSAEEMGEDALGALKKSMSGISDAMTADMDLTPTIRPILDLTNIRRNAMVIDGLLAPSSINPEASYGKAAGIAASDRATQQAMAEETFSTEDSSEPTLIYNQYNSSPKPLSRGEIYRQTKNQLSTVKGAVGTK